MDGLAPNRKCDNHEWACGQGSCGKRGVMGRPLQTRGSPLPQTQQWLCLLQKVQWASSELQPNIWFKRRRCPIRVFSAVVVDLVGKYISMLYKWNFFWWIMRSIIQIAFEFELLKCAEAATLYRCETIAMKTHKICYVYSLSRQLLRCPSAAACWFSLLLFWAKDLLIF